jgi:Family of unknown function (DUF5304)
LTTDDTQTPNHYPHGSMGEEAVKLAEAVQGWLGERTGRGPADVWAAATAPGAFESPECRVCPICRAMHFVTTMQPEVFAHLADAATSLAAAVRAMGEADGRAEQTSKGSRPAAAGFDGSADEPSGEA